MSKDLNNEIAKLKANLGNSEQVQNLYSKLENRLKDGSIPIEHF